MTESAKAGNSNNTYLYTKRGDVPTTAFCMLSSVSSTPRMAHIKAGVKVGKWKVISTSCATFEPYESHAMNREVVVSG